MAEYSLAGKRVWVCGHKGMVGGAVPNGGIVLSTQRLNSIRELDADNATLTVEAGCLLADVQAAAADVGFLFPLTLASEGSCRIGGNSAAAACSRSKSWASSCTA